MMKKLFALTVISLYCFSNLMAQNTITLEQCYQTAETNYPFTAQKNILASVTEESIQKINAVWSPQLYINAQATYQSEVTSLGISIPGIEINELSKHQYKATLDVSQLIYDGGISKQQRSIQSSINDIEIQKVNVEMYVIRERINQLYLTLMQADKQIELNKNLQRELANQSEQIKASKQFGIANQFQVDIVSAEVIKVEQREIEIQSAREAAIKMLSQLMGVSLSQDTKFELPAITFNVTDTISARPELKLLNLQSDLAFSQMAFADATTLPRLSLFAQGGYGRPGLNFLDDTFQFYYLGGIKLNYPLWTGNAKSHDAAIYNLNVARIEAYKQTYLINSSVQTTQQLVEVNKYAQLIEKDNEIIALKSKIKAGAQAQLDNGTLSADDFVKYLTAENDAKINLSIHEIQLLAAQINYLTILGKQ